MSTTCPDCRIEISLDDINVATDVALCRRCKRTHKLSELGAAAETERFDPERPPDGAFYRTTLRGFEVGASTRSLLALFLVPFTLVWAGGSLGGIYGSQLAERRFDPIMSMFGLPFLIGSIFLVGASLMTIAGKIVIRIEDDAGTIFTGVGPLTWKRRFALGEVERVSVEERIGNQGARQHVLALTLRSGKELTVLASPERLRFMRAALSRALSKRKAGR